MSGYAIRAEGLSKRYMIGGRDRNSYVSLRDVLMRAFKPSTWRKAPDEEFWALRDLSLDVKQGDVLGLIGRNGAGKSTFLKVLARITEPTHGRAELHGRIGSLLEVGTGFHPELTGRDNVYLSGTILGMRRHEISARFDEIVAFAEVEKFLDTQVKHYSSGMFTRLAFAVAAHLQPEILLVDEVLAVGDQAFQEKCLGKMQDISMGGRTVIFVSHNMDSIRKLCKTAAHLDGGRLKAVGPAEEIIESYLTQFHADGETSLQFDAERNGFAVDRVEILDLAENPAAGFGTWDSVRFRVHFRSPRPFNGGCVVLMIASTSGVMLTLVSTQPDNTLKLEFKEGANEIDVVFPQFQLAAGNYLLSVGLAVPNAEWLVRTEERVFVVHPKDVFRSGMAPRVPRYVVAQEHRWEPR